MVAEQRVLQGAVGSPALARRLYQKVAEQVQPWLLPVIEPVLGILAILGFGERFLEQAGHTREGPDSVRRLKIVRQS